MKTPGADSSVATLVKNRRDAEHGLGVPPVPAAAPAIITKPKAPTISVSPAILDAARKDGEELLKSLQTTAGGLTQKDAEARARQAGPSEVAQEQRKGWPIRLLKIIRNPLVILLTTLLAISFGTGDARAGTVMAAMVVLSVALRFLQEARADDAAAKLRALIHVTATVVRDGKPSEMPLRDLVPGDIVTVSAGDMIPGDVRVLTAKDLFVSRPASNKDEVTLWARDGWNEDEKSILNDARAAGVDSPLLFGYLPRVHHEDLRQAIASHVAAQETLDAYGPAATPEAIEARKAVETHLEVARLRIQELLGHVIGGAKVFLGGGQEAKWHFELADKVQDSADNALVRLFPQFSEADHANWGQVVTRARTGDVGALSQVQS